MRRTTTVVATLTALASLTALTGCTTPPAESADTPTPSDGAAVVVTPEVSAPVTRVAGRLPDRDRLALRRQVEKLVSGYVAAAFLDPTTAPADRFPGFTEGATRLARTDGAVLSRADLEEVGEAGPAAESAEPVVVQVLRAEAPLTVLAPRGRPAGATARLDLTLELTPGADEAASASPPESASALESASGAASVSEASSTTTTTTTVRLRGRLLLTPVGQGWRVFGFDVRRTDS